jgi:hypothetical protein
MAQSADPAFPSPFTPGEATSPTASLSPGAFTVSDIRIDGLQRIAAGTVFTYLPVERGDTLDQTSAGEAIRALYKTGFFEDITLSRQDNILVVTVKERPAINKLTLTGNKDIETEQLLQGLNDIGLSEGNTFDRLALDRVTQELTRQYNNRGKYNVEIAPAVTTLDRNRIDLTIEIKEGKAAKIRHINLIGNETYEDEDILDTWESAESNWLSWYRRDDQYSREKFSGDLEKLNSWYLDRGYVDFSIDTPQVAIGPDRQDMFITAGVTEGEKYTVSSVEVSGDTVLPKEQIERLVLVKPEQTFSRRLLEISSDSITATLGNVGYAFAQVNTIPDIDRENKAVGVNLQVVPGPRVNVRQIVFKGNTRTADEVLRREMRQFEGAWYSLQDPPAGAGLLRNRRCRNPAGRRQQRRSRRGLHPQGNHLGQLRVRPGLLAAERPDHPGAGVAEQLPRHRQSRRGAGAAQRLPATLRLLVHQSVLHRQRHVAGLQPVVARVRLRQLQHRAVLQHQRRRADGVRHTDHRNGLGTGPVRHRFQRDPRVPRPHPGVAGRLHRRHRPAYFPLLAH